MADFDYDLAPEAIAQQPAEPRDSARLLVDRGSTQPPSHLVVRDLIDLLHPGDVLVVNETRVIPARLPLRKATGGAVEVLLLEAGVDGAWTALVRPGKRVPPGTELSSVHDPDVRVEVGDRLDEGRRLVRVWVGNQLVDDPTKAELLQRAGRAPLPPYIHDDDPDADRYQTVYSARPGSVAAPTAGLHFTPELLAEIRAKGVGVATVDLVVGLDTFRPVMVEDPAQHVMHSERYEVPEATWAACQTAGRVVAVGTTTVRSLESAARGSLSGRTELFLRRGAEFEVVDAMITNFHLPRSTLLLMIDAFVGERWRRLYRTALDEGYRFLSYGDAMFLDRHLA